MVFITSQELIERFLQNIMRALYVLVPVLPERWQDCFRWDNMKKPRRLLYGIGTASEKAIIIWSCKTMES